MTTSRSQALTAWLACGYPEDPSDALLELVARAVDHGTSLSGRYFDRVPWVYAMTRHMPHEIAQLMEDNGLMDIRLVKRLDASGSFLTGRDYLQVLLGELLIPVVIYASYAAQGRLDTRAADRAAKRTRKAIKDGTQVTLVGVADRYRLPAAP